MPTENIKWLSLKKERQLKLLWNLTAKIIELGISNSKSLLDELENKIAIYKTHQDPALAAVFMLHNNLFKKPNLKQLTDFSIALERLCNIDLLETTFLVTKKDSLDSIVTAPIYLVLENIRSAFNVGAILRTADCLGVSELLFVGYTPRPDSPSVKKTALGSEENLSWSSYSAIKDATSYLKDKGVSIVSLETCEQSESLFEFKFPSSVAFLLGNERFGLSLEALTVSDCTVTIPTFGYKNSLNVSHAFAIAGYEALRQWKRS